MVLIVATPLSTSRTIGHGNGEVKVLIADSVDELLIEELERLGFKVSYKPKISRVELLNTIEDFDILIVRSRTKVDREVISRANKLKVIARAGVGLDNIDVEYARSKNIKIVNTPEAPTQSVAELTIGLMITAARKIVELCNNVKSGIWRKEYGFELYGKRLGIIGLGRIGGRVAEIAKAIGMDVIAYDVVDVSLKAKRLGVKLVSTIEELYEDSDIISLHVPLTKETYHMVSYREFNMMKDNVILINTSRGGVVDGKALLEALNKFKVLVAALDTLEHEPPKEPWEIELVKHPRVIVTPHIGSQTVEAQRRIAEVLVSKLVNIIEWVQRG